MSQTINVLVSNSNELTAPTDTASELLQSVKAAYPNITDLERYALFKHLEEPAQDSGDGQPHCAQDFERTQISKAAQRYIEYMAAKNLIENRKVVEPYQPRVARVVRGRHWDFD